MDLSKYLQEQIREFLEEKTKQKKDMLNKIREEEIDVFSIEKDYAKETQKALEENDVKKAKNIFDELRKTYNSLEKDDEKRNKYYAILEEVYVKIDKYLESQKDEKSLSQELKDFKNTPEKREFEQKALQDEEKYEQLDKNLKEIQQNLTKALKEENIDNAINYYKEYKQTFSTYPGDDLNRKVNWYKKVLQSYNDIINLKKELKEHHKEAIEEQKKEHQKENIKQNELAQIKRGKKAIEQAVAFLDQDNIFAAQSALIDAKHSIANITEEKTKHILEHMINKLTHRVEFLKTQTKMTQNGLSS